MDRLELNDLVMSAYFDSLKMTGREEIAGRLEKIYEVQRAEIIKEEVEDGKR